MKAIIFDIKRFAVHDGPGIRTTVFFKGCLMACTWCHNPESKSPDICTFPHTVRIGDKTFCDQEEIGREITVDALMTELRKELIFMEESGGGVTFSGGEPLQQHEFLTETLKTCKQEGIHTAVDTTGYSSWQVLEKVSKYTDLFLYDLKIMDDAVHQQFTGVSNQLILSNLQKLLENGTNLRIRIPCVKDVTLTEKNLQGIILFLKNQHHKPEAIDLLPFHSTAAHKYEKLNMNYSFKNVKSVTKDELEPAKKMFEDAGFTVQIGG